jgi:hypothetical protein
MPTDKSIPRLEPSRSTLAGKSIVPTSPTVVSARPGNDCAARKCSNCHAEDRAEIIQGEYDARGNARVEHFVTVELRYLRCHTEAEAHKRITPYMRSRGWKYKLFQTKHAMERLICRPCLRDLSIMERDWMRKAKGDSVNNKESFYGELCD